ncbi:MAG TPA: hypothetical protein ENI81_05685, partial [Phycisphaerales bacterium]|nr:hypothetical protein [Phycisphaerales bacterium]
MSGLKRFVCVVLLAHFGSASAQTGRPGFPNHHLHNFASSDAMTYHAKEMGYYFAGSRKPDDPAFAQIGIIRMLNARVGPVRVHIQKGRVQPERAGGFDESSSSHAGYPIKSPCTVQLSRAKE